MKIPCAQCHEPVDMPDAPQPRILDAPDVSVLVFNHPRQGFCLNCKQPVAMQLPGARLTIVAVAVAQQKEPPMIVVPHGRLV
jgi:hypothetical protein